MNLHPALIDRQRKPCCFDRQEWMALVSQRYGMTKHLKEDSAAYLKGWLESLKEEPTFT